MMDSGKVVGPSNLCQRGMLRRPETSSRGEKKKKRKLCISDDFALESPCFPSVEQLMCMRGFLSGY